MAQINKYYYEDLTPEILEHILDELKAGREVPPGPQDGREASAPVGGPNTLTNPALYANDPSGPEPGYAGTSVIPEAAKRPRAKPQPKKPRSR
jgi:NADH-quinone oxidoreductase subunit E